MVEIVVYARLSKAFNVAIWSLAAVTALGAVVAPKTSHTIIFVSIVLFLISKYMLDPKHPLSMTKGIWGTILYFLGSVLAFTGCILEHASISSMIFGVVVGLASIRWAKRSITREAKPTLKFRILMLLPRKDRADIVSDLRDDTADMRKAGCCEFSIWLHYAWHFSCTILRLYGAGLLKFLGFMAFLDKLR